MLAGKLSLVAGYHSSSIMPICCGANLGMGIPPGSLLLRNDRVEVDSCPDWKIASTLYPMSSLVGIHAPGRE